MFLLKLNTSADLLFSSAKKAIPNRDYLKATHGVPFPLTYEEMFSQPATGFPVGMLKESIWAIFRSCMYQEELRLYLRNREAFESSILKGAYDECTEVLERHREELGVSLWWAQAWMTLGENVPDCKRKDRQAEIDEAPVGSISSFMLRYLSRRAESRGSKVFLQEEISAALGELEDGFTTYAASRVFDLYSATPLELSSVMFYEGQSSLIDHYEAAVATLQAMASAHAIPSVAMTALKKPISVLTKCTGDKRLAPISLAFDCLATDAIDRGRDSRAQIFEAYLDGDYSSAIRRASEHLSDSDPTDAACLALLARAVVRAGSEIPKLPPPMLTMCASLVAIFSLRESSYGEATSVFSTVDSHYGHTWALYLRKAVLLCLQQETAKSLILQARDLMALDPYISPLSLACAGPSSVSEVRRTLQQKGIYAKTLPAMEVLFFGERASATSDRELSRRELSYLGRHLLGAGKSSLAVPILEQLIDKVHPDGRYRALAALAMAKAKIGDTQSALKLMTDSYIQCSDAPTSLPLNEVLGCLGEADTWPESIDVPICLELYNAFSSDNRLAELRYAFERYQEIHSIQVPSDVTRTVAQSEGGRAMLYLNRVWTPEVMRQTLLYNGSQEIGDARIEVCRQLASMDPANAEVYFDEIRARVKQDEIAKGTSLVEQSKVYVDIAAIKRNLKAKIGGQYSRYKASSSTRDEPSQIIVEKIADAILELQLNENRSISKTLSTLHLMNDVETETDSQFDPIFTEVTQEFLRGDHGLNAYLSTRVRHGVLANTLRKPVADEHLITTKDEGGVSYKPNTYWDERFDYHACRGLVTKALEHFAQSFDNLICELRDEYLQIAIYHGVKAAPQDSKAAFTYRSSNLERRFMQRYAVKSRTVDEFIDVCIDNLWEKTDENLVAVRKGLDNDFRQRFFALFDRLTEAISSIPYSTAIGDLRNCIFRAKTQLRLRLDEISSWFKRSQVYDRQDYQASLPVDIALNMIAKTVSESSEAPKIEVRTHDRSILMPGRTLDGMVDAFYVILSNAMEHSGLDIAALNIIVDFSLEPTRYCVRVESNLAPSIPSVVQREKVMSIRDGLNRSDSRRLAQLEGGSGLRKLWRSINSPFYAEPKLDFGFSEDGMFYVVVSYNIEAVNENPDS